MDVQQHLLPQSDPEIKGLDIAGESIYCEETGGDYYDYLEDDKNGQGMPFHWEYLRKKPIRNISARFNPARSS